MLSLPLLGLGLGLGLFGQATAGPYPPDVVDQLAAASMDKLRDYLAENPPAGGCTLDNAIKRQEWLVSNIFASLFWNC